MTQPSGATLRREGAVGIVTIRNPSARNALDDSTRRELLLRLLQANADPMSTAVVITGEAGHFCAGGELRSMPTERQAAAARLGEMHSIVRCVVEGPKPYIAAVEGSAYGSGFALASACDMVVAAPSAVFGSTFGRVGLAPDTGLAWTLPRRIGTQRARDFLLRGRVVDASTAHELGIVDLVDEGPDLTGSAVSLAQDWFGEASAAALASTRRLLESSSRDFGQFLDTELGLQSTLLGSRNFVEGRNAFFEKRAPKFENRRSDASSSS